MTGTGRDPYFRALQAALLEAGVAGPTLVVDRARLDANIDTLMGQLPENMGYRVVAKSLPSPDLLDHVRQRTGTDRLMTFNQPMLASLSRRMPEADQLLGKPLPVAAAANYLDALQAEQRPAIDQVQWLVDSRERLAQYQALAEARGLTLRINLELDVGLHRGGLTPGETLAGALEQLRRSERLTLSGFVGYEPHIASIPTWCGWRRRLWEKAQAVYRDAVEQAKEVFGQGVAGALTLNGGGSPTYRFHGKESPVSEVSVGSALVKPTHFDLPDLAPLQPAAFIATPVLKGPEATRIPGLEAFAGIAAQLKPSKARSLFIHGGHWLADPVDPPGLHYSRLVGRSSNQEMLLGGRELGVRPDEFVFLRPHQSEVVFLQFGDIAVYEDGAIVDWWPVFPPSA